MDKVKILVVDDEEYVLQMIECVCRHYSITLETSPLKALECIKEELFDIFIIDYQMPGMTGIELLEEIRKEYKNRPYVAVLSTAYGTISLFREELIRGLFFFFLEKPFKPESVKQVLHKAVAGLKKIKENERKRKI
jgi:CheY-like chemotaxis protein